MAKNGARRWKQWTRAQGLQALKDWQASGLKMSDYSKKTGISAQRLGWWRGQVEGWDGAGTTTGGSAPKAALPSSLQLVPVIATRALERTSASTATMHLPGGVAVEFDPAQVPPAWVAAVAIEVARAR